MLKGFFFFVLGFALATSIETVNWIVSTSSFLLFVLMILFYPQLAKIIWGETV